MYSLLGNDPEYAAFLKFSFLWKIIEGVLFYIVIILVYHICVYIERLNEKASNEIYLNKLVKDSELNLLKSQINPHFLFNGLNSVNALILKSPLQAQEMLIALSDYLRYTVSSIRKEISNLQEEIENIERYLSIEKLRFGEKLIYEFAIDPGCLSLRIPSMLLQPLFENAVKYGVYESTENVSILALARKEGDHLLFEISNDFDPENVKQRKGSGTGLKNTGERLRLFYGALASFRTRIEKGRFIVTLTIPV
jgi:LytS/YehU family sensor histidine kinase